MRTTRRALLRSGALVSTALLAGCTSGASNESSASSSSSASPTPTPTASSSGYSADDSAGDDGTTDALTTPSPDDLPETSGDTLTATMTTTNGEFRVELFAARVPTTVANFVGLATGQQAWRDPETGEVRTDPLYEDVPFHRVIDDFMIQCGDPTGTGRGGPGYTFDDEFDASLKHDSAGVLSMANRGPDTNGSQFFITLGPQPHLDGKHAVFGRVTDGMDVVQAIGDVSTDGNDRPREAVLLESVTVGGD